MNVAHIAVGKDLLIAVGGTALCSPLVRKNGRRHRSKMRLWPVDQTITTFVEYIHKPTFIVIMDLALHLTTDNYGTWCYVLVNGKLCLFKLCLEDIVNGNVKIIDEKIS